MMQSCCEAQESLMGPGEFLGAEEYHLETHKYLVLDSRDAQISLFKPI